MKRIPYLIWLVGITFLNEPRCNAQNLPDTISGIVSAEIKWIGQIPDEPGKNTTTHKIAGHILAAIAGSGRNEKQLIIKPISVATDKRSGLWIADQGNGWIIKSENNKCLPAPVFLKEKIFPKSIVGVCLLSDDRMLFSDSRANKIYVLDPGRKKATLFSPGFSFSQPTGIALNPVSHQIWVTETASHRISVFSETGQLIKQIGSRGTGTLEFNFPVSLCFDKTGYAYIVDALNYRIQVLDLNGNFIRVFGKQGNVSGTFAMPKGIATDSYGNLYITDALFHNVQIFDKGGHFLYAFGNQGRDKGEFWMPSGICIDLADKIYVADSYNARVQIFNLINIVKRNEGTSE